MGNYCTTSVTELPDASTVIEGTELPEWVSAGGKALFEQAANIAQSPYPSYTGPRITTYDGSKLTPEEQQAAEILGRGTSSFAPYVSEAGERAMGLGQGYDSMSREELLGPDYEGATREELIGKAMDPFSLESAQPYLDIYQTAADPAVREAGQTMFDTLAGIRAKASQGAGSFGSRLGILEGQTIADAARLKGDIRSQAARDALGFAAGRYDADRTARFDAESALRSAYETDEASRLKQIQSIQDAATTQENLKNAVAQGLMTSGEAERLLDQRSADLAYADYLDQREKPKQDLNFLLGLAQGVPYDTKTYSQQLGQSWQAQPSVYGQALSALGTLGSAYMMGNR